MKLKSRNSLPSDKEARAGCLSLPANNGIIRALSPPFTGINIRLFAALGLLSLSGAAAQASVTIATQMAKAYIHQPQQDRAPMRIYLKSAAIREADTA
ncbi:hypothetical protein [Neisseria meningitidis]|uniref:hypothetical protein n=1 Tax=Neisseria meningitidis TaxID=487 RepID=UPI00214B122F|nr:hypothetical protein [Neisseria meningitidis]